MAVDLTESVQLDSASSLPDNSVEASSPAAASILATDSTGKEPTSVTSDAVTGLTALAANTSFVPSATTSGSDSTQNQTKPKSTPRQCPALVVPHEYQPDGHPPHNHAQAHVVHSPKTLEKPSAERVLIVAANSGGSCTLQLGDYYTFLSMLDKLQYGNLHGYDVLLGMGNIDSTLLATWNKVGWMMKVSLMNPDACMSFTLRPDCKSITHVRCMHGRMVVTNNTCC